ncbi:hypothetical protein [Paenibacillus wenxiniae]|uniref:Uncharacterized protein n=1 Tax=Paenibacillus wenxiniae TaxID=1636843 RepID=A0ABW4RH20_9BACL
MMFNASSYNISDSIFKGQILVASDIKFKSINIQIPMGEAIIKVSFSMNNQYILIEDSTGGIFQGHAALILQDFFAESGMDADILDIEVLYIGRSYGSQEIPTRNVFDRLQHHETVQKIYSESSWNTDIWLTAWKFSPNSIAYFDPNEPNDGIRNYIHDFVESKKNNTEFLRFSKMQNIIVAEATLINYFKPIYNTQLKDKLSPLVSKYNEFYELDLDYIMLELDTSALGFSLWSQEVRVNKEHVIKYVFDSKKDFEDLFLE